MKIYNTMTRKKEEFVPVVPNKAGIYICGPTVYNFIHIGNARPCVVFDVLRRFLEYNRYEVNFVQNFTDIDDKIIAAANEEGVNYLEISNKYIQEFLRDMDGLNVKQACHYPRVTEEIPDIIKFVQSLINKGFAYEAQGAVYFLAPKADNYGKLSKKNIEDLEAGARVAVDAHKRNPSDFVLWKAAKPNEPSWESPWGPGRPGWHIECSVMSRKYIGDIVDIHAGGEDLIFPHHENEVAQSEAETAGRFVNYWMHNGMVLIDNQKMSKSENNFFLVRDIVKSFPYPILRFFILSVHYRSPLSFSEELLSAAASGLERIRNCRRNLIEAIKNDSGDDQVKNAGSFRDAFIESLMDDLNTANAVTAIFNTVSYANLAINQKTKDRPSLQGLLDDLDFMCDILGITLDTETAGKISPEEIEELIAQRNLAKAAKDFEKADGLRNQLAEKGVIIKDTREGTKWHYE